MARRRPACRASVRPARPLRQPHAGALAGRRSLLVLDTRAGTPAEALYRATGWTELGTIPGGELGPDRKPADVVHFWKQVST